MKQIFKTQGIFTFLLLCFSNNKNNIQTLGINELHINDLILHALQQTQALALIDHIEIIYPDLRFEEKDPRLNSKDFSNKRSMSFLTFVFFLVAQSILLCVYKATLIFICSKKLIGDNSFETIEIGAIIVTILVFVYSLFMRYSYLKTYNQIPVFFSFLLILFACLSNWCFSEKASKPHFVFLLADLFFNSFSVFPIFLLLQKKVVIHVQKEQIENYRVIQLKEDPVTELEEYLQYSLNPIRQESICKMTVLKQGLTILGNIYLGIFVLSIIMDFLILRKKTKRLNGLLFILPKIIPLIICLGYYYSDLCFYDQKVVYHITFEDPTIVIGTIARLKLEQMFAPNLELYTSKNADPAVDLFFDQKDHKIVLEIEKRQE